MARVDLYWLPLGAGGRSVRLNGKVFEAAAAARGRRPRRDLYHSALVVSAGEDAYVLEVTPVPRGGGGRGVVAEGAVGSRWAGRLRLFRYEVRCWRGGTIPDVEEAVESPRRLSRDPAVAQRILDLAPEVPAAVWGRDDLGAGEMWNSNSVTSWLVERGGLDADAIEPPVGGRAPGWGAGVAAARSAVAETGRVLPAEVERDAEEQRARPEVDRVERERLVVADQRRDEPDGEPENGHAATLRPAAGASIRNFPYSGDTPDGATDERTR